MSNALDASVTLDDIFAVVQSKRVPLAAELAGYLALEIAEGADPLGGDVDALRVYVGEEGSVALVKHRRESVSGDAERSVRTILYRLLEASGSQTPALAAAAKRKPNGGLPALSMELEAALIPVNRAAGRRALARLAREVRRVTLGVGRNAPNPMALERLGSRASYPSHSGHSGHSGQPSQPGPRSSDSLTDALAPRVPSAAPPPDALEVSRPAPTSQDAPRIDISELPTIPLETARTESAVSKRAEQNDVDSLLASFEVSEQRGDRDLARDLKAMVGLDPTPPPPQVTRRSTREHAVANESDADIESLLSMSEPASPVAERPSSAAVPNDRLAGAIPVEISSSTHVVPIATSRHSFAAERALASVIPPPLSPIPPSEAPTNSVPDHRAGALSVPALDRLLDTQASRIRKEGAEAKTKRSDVLLVLLALFALGAGAMALWLLKPGFLSGRTPEKVAADRRASEAASARARAENEALACRATLTVTDLPSQAEVLLRMGHAPVDIAHMPVGARLEFVALADGYAPKRAVVPAGATWDRGADGKPRFEVAVQLDAIKSREAVADLWPSAEPGSEVGGNGAPGTVHIVSTPRGVDVWLLAGAGPEAKIEQLRCDDTIDVLVAGPTTYRKRLRIAPSDFVVGTDATRHSATISAKSTHP
jgi:hypothetical protein